MMAGTETVSPSNTSDLLPRRSSRFKLVTWTLAEVESMPYKVLVDESHETGYLLGVRLRSGRKGQHVMRAHVVHHDEGTRFRKGDPVVVKAFSDSFEATKEALLTKQACGSRRHRRSATRVVRLLDLLTDEDFSYMVLEYLNGGDLCDRILSMDGRSVPPCLARLWYYDLLHSMIYLRAQRIAHMDISPENILLDENGRCKLIDFGMSIFLPRNHEPETVYPGLAKSGKASYISPEVYKGEPYDPVKADIWSLGAVFYVIATGQPLYRMPGDPAFNKLQQGKFNQLVNYYQTLGCVVPEGPTRDMIRAMLNPVPSLRPTAAEILEFSPLFN